MAVRSMCCGGSRNLDSYQTNREIWLYLLMEMYKFMRSWRKEVKAVGSFTVNKYVGLWYYQKICGRYFCTKLLPTCNFAWKSIHFAKIFT